MSERVDVPQATLERTREIVDAIARGARSRAGISGATGIALRQVAYGVASARILGLVEGNDDLWLTELGRAVAATDSGSGEEASVLRRAIDGSDALVRIAPGLVSSEPPTREAVIERIREHAGLSSSTAAHRAGMLFGWRKRLLETPDPRDVKARQLGARWRRIEVKGLRSLEHLSLDIGPLTVVHGPTASGKSSVADAFRLAYEWGVDPAGAIERAGGIAALARHGRGPIAIEHRVAATREALEHSHRSHRITIGSEGDAWWVADERWSVTHQGETLLDVHREGERLTLGSDALPIGRQEAILQSTAGERAVVRHASVRPAFRLALDLSKMREPCGSEEVRITANGANLAAALERIQASRSFPGLVETLRNIVPGLGDLTVERGADDRARIVATQILAPGIEARLGAESLSDGTLLALGVLVAAHQLAADELMIVELAALPLDPVSLALVVDALAAASRRATVLLTTSDDELASAIGADVHVHCRFRGGRTEVGAPGLRVVGTAPLPFG